MPMLNMSLNPPLAKQVPLPNFAVHQKAAMDAFVEHQTLLGDPKGYTARLGAAGYAQALAIATARADAADVAFRSVMAGGA